MRVAPAPQSFVAVSLLMSALGACGQDAASPPAPQQTQSQTQTQLPAGKPSPPLKTRPKPEFGPAPKVTQVIMVNGRPYKPPTRPEQFKDYLRDSYGLPAQARNTLRALYSEGRDKPDGWGQDFPGFMQRYGAVAGITAINGNVRYAMENIFHEDLRYLPCHNCDVKHKIENALLSEVTARHDDDGHRFFTLTPTVADYTGPIVAHCLYYPGGVSPGAGAVSARLVLATRIGQHLFTEFVMERRHRKKTKDQ